jgi:uncharacterized membrane protein (UPF0127 family)
MEQKVPFRLRGNRSVEVLGVRVPVAARLPCRLMGLALLRRQRAGSGLLLPGCRSVHTFGMFFRLDVHFIDAAGREIRVERAVSPGRILFEWRAVAVLEMPAEGGESASPAP